MSLAGTVARNTSLLTLGRLVSAGANALGVVVSTRYLGPEAFGSFTIAIVFMAIVLPLTDLGLYTIASRELARRPDEEARLLASVFTMGLVLAGGIALLAFGALAIAYGGSDDRLVREGVGILMVQVLLAAPGATVAALLIARQRIGPLVAAAFVSSAVLVLALWVATSLDWGFGGVVVAYAASAVTSSVIPLLGTRATLRLRLALDRQLWRQLGTWALPQGGILVLGHLYFRIDTFLISFLKTKSEVAVYGAAYRIVELLIVFPGIFLLTFFPVLSRLAPHSSDLNGIVSKASASLQVAVVPLLVLFIGFADQIIEVVAGPGFEDSVLVLRLLMLGTGIIYVTTLYFQVLVALGLQARLFRMLLGVLACNVPINLVLIPIYGAPGAAAAVTVSELTALVLVRRIYRSVGTLPRLHRPARVVIAGVGMAAVVLAFELAGTEAALPPLVVLVAGALAASTVYIALLHVLKAMPETIALAFASAGRRFRWS